MYQIYSTEALVVSYTNTGEANRRYKLLCATQGLIYATAISVRKESSKNRYFLQSLTLFNVSLVPSKTGFRITGGENSQSLVLGKKTKESFMQVLRLVGRLLPTNKEQAEDEEQHIFNVLKAGLLSGKIANEEKSEAFELLLIARVLFILGYFDLGEFEEKIRNCFTTTEVSSEFLNIVAEHKIKVTAYINKCLKQTQL